MKIKGKEWKQEDIQYLHEHLSKKQDFCKALGYADGKHYGRIIERLKLNKEDFGKYAEDYHGKLIKNGDIFSMLTVIKANCEQNSHGDWKSLCQCECGGKAIIRNVDLKRGNSKSCGCLSGHNDENRIYNGQIFGKLTIINANCSYSQGTTRPWLMSECVCECGGKILVRNCSLRSGHVLSCGCLKSRGENKVEQVLKNLGLDYQKQYRFKDLLGDSDKMLSFDFVIFTNQKIKFALEYQGQQHYYPIEYFGGEEKFYKQKEYDNKKRKYCKENNIILIEIPYTDYELINEDYIKKIIA